MKLTVTLRLLFLFALLSFEFPCFAQNAARFSEEVEQITADDKSLNKKDVILFTGSSSIRIWNSLQSDFPKYNIVNRGFGGSQTSDLVYFFDRLVLPYNPKKIFIYEGDNDISVGKSTEQILASMDSVITLIRQKVSPTVPVYLISPKPSIARWNLKDKYIEFNKQMSELASRRNQVYFIDVWTPAIGADGTVFKDIFLEDGLHMNAKGYAIWVKVFRKYLP